MRVHTLSSLRSSGQFMRAGMNMGSTHVNSLGDYCGAVTGQSMPTNYLSQQQQLQHSPISGTYFGHHHQISPIIEDEENVVESTSLLNPRDPSPYAGNISSNALGNASGIGQLDAADGSARLALNNFNEDTIASGQLSGGIGIFHGHNDELINEPERLAIYGEQRPLS